MHGKVLQSDEWIFTAIVHQYSWTVSWYNNVVKQSNGKDNEEL